MNNKPYVVLIFLIAFKITAVAQIRSLAFIRYVNSDAELPQLYDSIRLPLLVAGKAVYVIDADCISTKARNARSDGGNVSSRNSRNSGGDISGRNTRNSGGDVSAHNTRNSGGNVSERNARNDGGGASARNTRNSGGDISSRNTRNSGGDIGGGCGCEVNDSGKFIVLIPAIHKNEEIRIYYEHLFIDEKSFKIKMI